ncbi:MAG: TlpA disulfide reductase family protein, partial [Bacteroidota bacterium]
QSCHSCSVTTFENYEEVDGLIVPLNKTVSIEEAGYIQEYEYQEIEFNNQFPENHFEFQEQWKSLTVGSKAPSFNLPLIADKSKMINNSVLEGKITLVDFWATWCKPCLQEFPVIDAQYQKFKDKGFQVVSISIDKDIRKPKAFLEKAPFSWDYSLYSEGEFESELATAYQVAGLPKTILFDREGKIIATDAELRGDKLESVLDNIFLNN